MDELYHTLKKIKVLTAVDRNRFKNIAFKVGNGRKENYIEMAIELEEKYNIRYTCTDKYEAYCHYKKQRFT